MTAGPGASARACRLHRVGAAASVRQGVALEAHRVFLQRADARGLGLLAPGLQLAQALLGVVAARLEQGGQAGAMLDQLLDPRTLLHPFAQLLARIRLEPAAIV